MHGRPSHRLQQGFKDGRRLFRLMRVASRSQRGSPRRLNASAGLAAANPGRHPAAVGGIVLVVASRPLCADNTVLATSRAARAPGRSFRRNGDGCVLDRSALGVLILCWLGD
mmetsp:Transcript_15817/g.42906  ORF Transcript_15817/g.42906 Transcript_15817/m.42906 type:complete len:112 (+) Transcript_15817:477-812(+)